MDSMLKFLNNCLKDVNPDVITKGDLRKKYMEEMELTELSKEDKKLFSSAVNTAYLSVVSSKNTCFNNGTDEEKPVNNADIQKGAESGEENSTESSMDSSSEDDIAPENITEETFEGKAATNGSNSSMGLSDTEEPADVEDNKKMSKISDEDDGFSSAVSSNLNISPKKSLVSKKLLSKRNGRKLESDSEDEPPESFKSKLKMKKSPAFSRKQSVKRPLTSSSDEDFSNEKELVKNKKLLKNTVQQESKCKAESVAKSAKKAKHTNGVDKSLTADTKNKSKSINKSIESTKLISSGSEDEPLIKFNKKKSNNSIESEDEPDCRAENNLNSIRSSLNSSRKISSESEDEPLTKYSKDKSDNSLGLEAESVVNVLTKKKSDSFKKSFNSTIKNSSESEDEPLTKFSKKKSNSMSGSLSYKKVSSESEDEPLTKYSKKKLDTSLNSEDEAIVNTLSRKKSNSFNKSFNSTRKDSSESEDEPLTKFSKKISNSRSGSSNSKKVSGESEDEPLTKYSKKKSNSVSKSLNSTKKYSSESEDEPLKNLSERKSSNSLDSEDEPDYRNKSKSNSNDGPLNSRKNSSSKSVNEVLEKFSKSNVKISLEGDSKLTEIVSESNKLNGKPLTGLNKKKRKRSSNDPDDVKLTNKKSNRTDVRKNSFSELSNSGENVHNSNLNGKEDNISSDSEDEPLNKLSAKDSISKSFQSDSSLSADENEELSTAKGEKNKQSKRKVDNDPGKEKRSSASANKIEHLKKYVRAAGIRVQNYTKLFENCKSTKAKCGKLIDLLEKEGLKGRPTLQKCKKLKKKIETKKEIAELDVSNILKTEGRRPKRGACSDATNCKVEEKSSTPMKNFSRLRDILDSEESD